MREVCFLLLPMSFPAKHQIFQSGDIARELYVIMNGMVDVSDSVI